MQKSQRTLFPIQDEESWAFYKKQRDSFWFPSEIDLSDEASSLNLMNETEKNVLLQQSLSKNVLKFTPSTTVTHTQ